LAKLESVIKEAIARGARRQLRLALTPLRREVSRMRRRVAEMQSALATLDRKAAGWERLRETVPAIPPVSESAARAARLSPRLVRSLRRRLGVSQTALGRLVGVSAAAVAHWEGGTAAPAGQKRATLVALRGVGRREIKALLAREAEARGARKTPRAKPRRSRRGRRKARR
jgi:DNA-binding transcriptional regulator YiaG